MRRRTFIAFLSGTAVVGSLDAWAQQLQPPLIAVLEGASAATDRYDAFRAGLRELGYVEGVNIRLEYRYADLLADNERDWETLFRQKTAGRLTTGFPRRQAASFDVRRVCAEPTVSKQ